MHTIVQQLLIIVLSLARELDGLDHMSIVPHSYMEQTLNQPINHSPVADWHLNLVRRFYKRDHELCLKYARVVRLHVLPRKF